MKNLSKTLFILFVLGINFSFAQKTKNNDSHLLVGTYTSGKSEGIYVYKFNVQTGDFVAESVAKGIKNPSFLTVSPDSKFVYSVGETDGGGGVHAFSFDKETGTLTKINSQSAKGDNPCHITIDKTGKTVIAGNYSGGNLSVFSVQANGGLAEASQTLQHEGKGTNAARQEKAHVHSVNIAPNNIDVFVPDLGIDKIVTYTLDAKTGKLTTGRIPFTKVQDGSGPRHFTFHPNGKFAYVIQELTGQVTAFDYKNASLVALQTISAFPPNYKGEFSCADIHISPDGKFLYGSNRGDNTLVIYSIDAKTGKLTYLTNQSVLGKKPRNFMIDPSGNFVLVANQDSDNIIIFRRDTKTGLLTATGKEIAVPNPVCLKMVEMQ